MMEWMTDEILLYGGIAAAVSALAAAFFSFCVHQIRRVRLNAKLDKEYGEE